MWEERFEDENCTVGSWWLELSREIEKSSSYRERSKRMTRNKGMEWERNASIMHTSLEG